LSEKLEITQERVLQELAAVAFADAADFVNVTTVNRPDVGIHPLTGEAIGVPRDQRCVKFTDTATLPKEKRAALAAVKQSANGNLEIRLHDKVRALELLSKHLGLLDSGKHSADVEDLAPLGELLRNAKD
jgi:phage terminase small subunit